MESTEIINIFQSHLNENLAAPVMVSGSDERPVPGVVIEDWNVTKMTGSMNDYIGSKYDGVGTETARVFRIPYECRISMMVRDHGEVASSRLFDAVREELMKLETRPSRLSDRLSTITMGDGGGVSHQFVSTTESEFSQSVTIGSSLIFEDTDYDTIEEFANNFEITI